MPLSTKELEIITRSQAKAKAAIEDVLEPLVALDNTSIPRSTQIDLMQVQLALRLQSNAIDHLVEVMEYESSFLKPMTST